MIVKYNLGVHDPSRLQAGCSTFQYETEDAEEQPLICRLRPMCSAGVAKNANVKKTSTLSSPGNQDRNNSYPHHSKTCIHEEEVQFFYL